ncbi:MAG: hypothetical protein AB1489_27500, partial [Acidobacteriota bacterium]
MNEQRPPLTPNKPRETSQAYEPGGHLVIRKESGPARCEICHKSDQLDPQTGTCQRCSGLTVPTSTEGNLNAGRPIFNTIDRNTISNHQWTVVAITLCLFIGSIAYRMISGVGLQQTSMLFIGLPTFLAVILALTPRARTAKGMILKGITIALLMSGILLGEGLICIVMASPIFFIVGLVVGAIWDEIREREMRRQLKSLLLLPLLIMSLEGTTDWLSFSRDETVTVERLVMAS